jgi:hypothetical protein
VKAQDRRGVERDDHPNRVPAGGHPVKHSQRQHRRAAPEAPGPERHNDLARVIRILTLPLMPAAPLLVIVQRIWLGWCRLQATVACLPDGPLTAEVNGGCEPWLNRAVAVS